MGSQWLVDERMEGIGSPLSLLIVLGMAPQSYTAGSTNWIQGY